MVDGGKNGVAGEGENGRIGVQRPQSAKREIRQSKAQRRRHELQGNDQFDEEGDNTPKDGRQQKPATTASL